MISIIIPTINPSQIIQLSENIAQTIGLEYEIIPFENHQKKWSICKIYNYCAEKAKYEYIVFCHEDILFQTQDWGNKLINLLKKEEIGLVGISGALYKAKAPAPWVSIPTEYYRSNQKLKKFGDYQQKFVEVAVLDGFFLAVTKDNWKDNSFNEKDLNGFHIYDIDYSRQFRNKKKVVTYEIQVEHLSEGNFDKNWFLDSYKYYAQYKKEFPLTLLSVQKKIDRKLEAYAWRSLAIRLKKKNIQKKYIIWACFYHFLNNPISIDNLKLLKLYIHK